MSVAFTLVAEEEKEEEGEEEEPIEVQRDSFLVRSVARLHPSPSRSTRTPCCAWRSTPF